MRKQRGENHALPMRARGTEKTCQQVCVGMVARSFVLHRGRTVSAGVHESTESQVSPYQEQKTSHVESKING